MKRLLLLSLTVGTIAALAVYSLFGQSPASEPAATFWLPVTLGLLLASVWVFIACLANWNTVERHQGLIWTRQGLLFGGSACVLLYLQGLRVLNVTDAILIIVAAILLELFFRAEKTDQRTPH